MWGKKEISRRKKSLLCLVFLWKIWTLITLCLELYDKIIDWPQNKINKKMKEVKYDSSAHGVTRARLWLMNGDLEGEWTLGSSCKRIRISSSNTDIIQDIPFFLSNLSSLTGYMSSSRSEDGDLALLGLVISGTLLSISCSSEALGSKED